MSAGGVQSRVAELKAAIILLTRLPLPALSPFPPQGRVVWAYPVAGAGIGLVGGFVMLSAGLVLPGYMGALLGLVFTILLTGALHEDGFADFWDGIGGGRDAADKLRIMRDHHLGTYGALALIVSFTSRLAALAAIGPLAPLAFICGHAMARGALALPMRLFLPARRDGLTAEAGKPGTAAFLAAIALPLVLAALLLPIAPALAACGAVCVAALAIGALAQLQLGGITGDVLGAAEQSGEIVFLWVLAVLLAA